MGGGRPGLDDLGDDWRIAPGFDVGRFIAEGYADPPHTPRIPTPPSPY